MSKFAVYAAKAVAFFKSAQGKRDVALVVAAIGGAVEAYHRIFG
jgi:hypothetical protein